VHGHTGSLKIWVLNSNEVPGDIFEIESGLLPVLPCDAVLLEGDCILNEALLTGESTTISKTPIPNSELRALDFETEEPATSQHMSSYFLFCGTKIIRVRHSRVASAMYTPSSSKRGISRLI
jgi:cation-transporting P-type ATPase 13A2